MERKRQRDAANVVQAPARAWVARQLVQEVREELKDINALRLRMACTLHRFWRVVIAKEVRRGLADTKARAYLQTAFTIQSWYRGVKGRFAFHLLRCAKQARYEMQCECVVVLQAQARGWAQRRRYRVILDEIELQEKIRAVLKLQVRIVV